MPFLLRATPQLDLADWSVRSEANLTATGHSRDTPDQTHDATNQRTALHSILHQGNLRYVTGQTQVVFSADQAAAALWTYGEDNLVPRAMDMSIDDLRVTWRLAGDHWREDHRLPLRSRLVLDKVTAFACIEFLEGELRPLATERRRASKLMPESLRNAQPVPPGTKTDVDRRS